MSKHKGLRCGCGLPMSVNPHPKAGDPKTLCSVGAVMVCIPCACKSLKKSSDNNWKLQRHVMDLVDALRELHDFAGPQLDGRHGERSQKAFKRASELLSQFEVA